MQRWLRVCQLSTACTRKGWIQNSRWIMASSFAWWTVWKRTTKFFLIRFSAYDSRFPAIHTCVTSPNLPDDSGFSSCPPKKQRHTCKIKKIRNSVSAANVLLLPPPPHDREKKLCAQRELTLEPLEDCCAVWWICAVKNNKKKLLLSTDFTCTWVLDGKSSARRSLCGFSTQFITRVIDFDNIHRKNHSW